MSKTRRSKDEKERLAIEATDRQQEHNKLTILEKIAKLDARLGVNTGAKKERLRLQRLLEAEIKKQDLAEDIKEIDEVKEKKRSKKPKRQKKDRSKKHRR